MFFHVCCIIIRVEVSVFIGVFSKTVAEDLLCDGCACHAIEVSCCCMPEQMCMKVFMDAGIVGNIAKGIL